MIKKLVDKIKKLDNKYKIIFFRWWFSAAVCFFIVWGTQLGAQETTFELIFFLGLGMAIGNLFIFNPIISSVFDIERRGKIANKKMSERTVLEGVFYMLSEVFKSMISVYVVSWIYEGINLLINYLGNFADSHVGFPVEPITFGIFFVIIYSILGFVWDLIVILYEKIFKKGQGKVNSEESI